MCIHNTYIYIYTERQTERERGIRARHGNPHSHSHPSIDKSRLSCQRQRSADGLLQRSQLIGLGIRPKMGILPSGYLTEPWYRWPIEIDGLPIKNGWIFHGELLNNQRVFTLLFTFKAWGLNLNLT